MQEYTALFGIFAALAVGAASPGPSFVLVARMSVSSSRQSGLLAAAGMGAGGVVFASAALLGLHAILLAVPSLYLGLKVVGGLYLMYLGVKIWFSSNEPLSEDGGVKLSERSRPALAFGAGLATQLSNPKTAIVYASVFAAFLPPETTLTFNVLLVGLVLLIESGWYGSNRTLEHRSSSNILGLQAVVRPSRRRRHGLPGRKTRHLTA